MHSCVVLCSWHATVPEQMHLHSSLPCCSGLQTLATPALLTSSPPKVNTLLTCTKFARLTLPAGTSSADRVKQADRQTNGGPVKHSSPDSHTPAPPAAATAAAAALVGDASPGRGRAALPAVLLLLVAAVAALSRMNWPSSCGRDVSSSLVKTCRQR